MTFWSAARELASSVLPPASGLSDADLITAQRELARRVVEAAEAMYAGELAQRSSHELGHSGLAQRNGARTPEQFLATLTGMTRADARQLVRVGTATEPWLDAPIEALQSGTLSVAGVDAIRSGLGQATEGVPDDALARAAERLTARAAELDADELAAEARRARDQLDVDGVAAREEQLRARRSARLYTRPDGMLALSALFPPESAAEVRAALDSAVTPRRSPRFAEQGEGDDHPAPDDRTPEQLTHDALVQLITLGAAVAPTEVVDHERPAVRVLVTKSDLEAGTGAGYFDGQSEPVSIATVERMICGSGIIPLLFDSNGAGMDVGREQRLHTRRQRILIGARDGGCTVDGCGRPNSWAEVHHIVPWSRGGVTSIENAISLCRHHHLLLHNNEWSVERDGPRMTMVPPPGSGLARIRLVSKSGALARLLQPA